MSIAQDSEGRRRSANAALGVVQICATPFKSGAGARRRPGAGAAKWYRGRCRVKMHGARGSRPRSRATRGLPAAVALCGHPVHGPRRAAPAAVVRRPQIGPRVRAGPAVDRTGAVLRQNKCHNATRLQQVHRSTRANAIRPIVVWCIRV